MQERLYDKYGQPYKAKAGEDPHNIGLSLEYVFEILDPVLEIARASAQFCLGEQSETLSLKVSCVPLLSIRQGWTLQGQVDTSPTHALTVSGGIASTCLGLPHQNIPDLILLTAAAGR